MTGTDQDPSENDAKPVEGEILTPGKGLPARSLPEPEGLINTLFWRSVRYYNLRKTFEIYEKAVRAAAASERAEGDLHDARLEHSRAVARLRELPTILHVDADQRKRARELAADRDEFEKVDLALRTALKREALDNIKQDTHATFATREAEPDEVADFQKKIETFYKDLGRLREHKKKLIAEIKTLDLDPEEEKILIQQVEADFEEFEDRLREKIS